jgi:hypothetical protein
VSEIFLQSLQRKFLPAVYSETHDQANALKKHFATQFERKESFSTEHFEMPTYISAMSKPS